MTFPLKKQLVLLKFNVDENQFFLNRHCEDENE